jgi:Leucine-rich repeat (LRR) protein
MRLSNLLEAKERSVLSVVGKQRVNVHDFECTHLRLTSLEGCPKNVTGSFDCQANQLTSLLGCPAKVGSFSCYDNKLTSLEGGPVEIKDGGYSCSDNLLTSLLGCPTEIKGTFNCYNNKLSSLAGFPAKLDGRGNCYGNNLTSLQGIHKQLKEAKSLDFSANPIKSHVLGLLKIKGLETIELSRKGVQDIINKHLAGERDVMACQDELMDAGFEEYAKL